MTSPDSASPSDNSEKVVLARLLMPDDANISGNVHGGTILQLMEQAGMISATRYFNSDPTSEHYEKQVAGLARFETMSFHQPVFVGEIASLSTSLVFTSDRSVLIKVTVSAENAMSGKTRLTNTGMLWYLSFAKPKGKKEHEVVTIPQMTPPTDDIKALKAYEKGKALYEARKQQEETPKDCLGIDGCLCPSCRGKYTPTTEQSSSPLDSKQTLCQVVLPGDCGTSNIAFGGFVMKLMDTAAGCCAFRHARTNIVTVSISSMDFINVVHLGDIVTIDATMRFTSAKSMEIMVVARVTSMTKKDVEVARGTFTFVALDNKTNKVVGVPALVPSTEEEFDLAFRSQVKYEASKRARLAAANQ